MASDPPDFFISYARPDRDWAFWIAGVLESEGYTARVDARDFKIGRSIPREIRKALAECKRTVAVLSQSYQESRYAQAELAAVFNADPSGEQGKLVPVRIGRTTPDPLFDQMLFIDLVGLDREAARLLLLDKIKEGPARPFQGPFPGRTRRTGPVWLLLSAAILLAGGGGLAAWKARQDGDRVGDIRPSPSVDASTSHGEKEGTSHGPPRTPDAASGEPPRPKEKLAWDAPITATVVDAGHHYFRETKSCQVSMEPDAGTVFVVCRCRNGRTDYDRPRPVYPPTWRRARELTLNFPWRCP